MIVRSRLPVIVALAGTAAAAFAQPVRMPEHGQLLVTPAYAYQNFEDFWAGDTETPLPGDHTQHTGLLNLDYGILPNLAADVTLGYAYSELPSVGSDDGLADTYLGVRYRLVNQQTSSCAWAPDVTVRLGGVIAGTYDANFPFGAGDGVHGVDFTLMLAKTFGKSGFGLYGDAGYRLRESPAPDEFYARAGAVQRFGFVTLSLGYRHLESTSGLDIGVPPFDPAAGEDTGFPALEEIQQLLEGTLTFEDRGGRTYRFLVGHAIDGRNTGNKLMLGFALTLPFQLRH